jgi:agmatine deiminase
VKVALAQFSMSDSPERNLETAISFIREASAKKAQVVCLPELFRSPYFCVEERCRTDYSEELPGSLGAALRNEAANAKIAIVAGSVYERTSSGELYNTSMVIDAHGMLLGAYRKVHIPHDPSFYERNYFKPGDQGFKVFDLGFAKVGVLICYDQWFPEAARALALAGAEIIFYPTAISHVAGIEQSEGEWQRAWEIVQCGHAVANNVVVCAANRVGAEGGSNFWGGSFVCDAFGQLLAKGDTEPGLILADVDLGHSQYVRDSWRFMVSRRPEQYGAVTQEEERV